jgi:D-alanyl-D-alanine carboxypeptidase/D-alanyl-D-alanine-endopeptidase (penicillin-binding protein 4)
VPAALAAPGSAEIVASSRAVTFGDHVTISGTATAEAGCVAGRAVQLEWRPADSAAFTTVGQGTTAGDGTFSFDQSQRYSGWFRATLPQDSSCAQVVSGEVEVRVRALVDSTLTAGSLTAGSCVDVRATVSPAKPGQTVDLQRQGAGRWTTIDTLPLDDASEANARPCFGWGDIGVVRLRVRWSSQDALNGTNAGITLGFQITEAPWMERIGDLVDNRAMSISVGEAGAYLYEHAGAAPRTPASNEKLLLSMALLDTLGPGFRIVTHAGSRAAATGGTLKGDLWILGRGDPSIGRATMTALARRIADSGVQRITGRVMGATTYFRRDWDATGWNDVARDYVARPTALAFEGNLGPGGADVADPEWRAAEILTQRLEDLGVRITGTSGSGSPPQDLTDLATVRSAPLEHLLVKLLRPSDNFLAEMLGKRLGAETAGIPGTIAKGAAAIESWVDGHGVDFTSYDNSGLSYANRVTADGIVRLLWEAEAASWGDDLLRALPEGGQGTLRDRLANVRVRAKTGTLTSISALSGWVWLERLDAWGEFSILSDGMSKTTASDLEDRIARIVQNNAA